MLTRLRQVLVAFLVAATVVGVPAGTPAGEITGLVRDYVSKAPLDGVRVSIDKKDEPKPVATVKGRYKLENVGAGKHKLVFDMTGYTPRPHNHDCELDKKEDKKEVDTELLMEEPANPDYFDNAGKRFVEYVRADGGKKEHYAARWQQLRRFAPHPVSKVRIAESIARNDPAAVKLLPLSQYRGVNAKFFDPLLTAFALDEPRLKVPDKSLTDKLGEELVADVTIYALRKSKADAKTKVEFVEAMKAQWGSSGAVEIVVAWAKQEPIPENEPKYFAAENKKIVGRWSLTENDAIVITYVFSEDKKVVVAGKTNGKEVKVSGTYTFDGKTVSMMLVDGEDKKTDTFTVLKLTKDEIDYQTTEGAKGTLKREKDK